jgi:hypothetical protein
MYEVIYKVHGEKMVKLACLSLHGAKVKLAQVKAFLYQGGYDVEIHPRITYTGDDVYEVSIC